MRAATVAGGTVDAGAALAGGEARTTRAAAGADVAGGGGVGPTADDDVPHAAPDARTRIAAATATARLIAGLNAGLTRSLR